MPDGSRHRLGVWVVRIALMLNGQRRNVSHSPGREPYFPFSTTIAARSSAARIGSTPAW